MNIYVGNLSYSTTEHDLNTVFSAYGRVGNVRLVTDQDTGRSKGFGFVEMDDASVALAAIAGLNGKSLDGRGLSVSEARPREEHGRNGYQRQGNRR